MAKIYEIAFELAGKLQGSFNNSFGSASSKIQDLHNKLVDLNSESKNLNKFTSLSAEVKKNEAALIAARQEYARVSSELKNYAYSMDALKSEAIQARAAYARLSKEMKNNETPSDELRKKHAEAKARLDELNRSIKEQDGLLQKQQAAKDRVQSLNLKLGEQKQKLFEQSAALKKAGIDTKDLSKANEQLAQSIERARKAQQRLMELEAKRKANEQMRANAKGAVLETAAVGAAAMTPLLAYAKAENAATGLKVAMMGANGEVSESYAKITKLATELGNKLPGTTAQFQEMMTMLKRQGMSDGAILGGVGKAAAYLAVLLKKDSSAAAEFAAKMQDATATSEKDMMSLFDTIQRTFYLGVDDNNMLQFFTKMSPVMAMVKKEGLEFANAFAPMAVMLDQAGMKGEAAGNAIRKVVQSGFDTKKLKKAAKEFGVSLKFTDSKGEFAGIENMYKQLQKLKKLSTEKRTMFLKEAFGDDAETQQVLSVLMNKGIEGYNEALDRMKNQADIQKRVDAQLKTLSNLWESFTGTVINILASIGQPIAAKLSPIFEQISNWVSDTLAPWVEKNGELVGTIGMAVMGFTALKLSVLAGTFAFTTMQSAYFTIQTIMNATKVWTALQWAFNAAMAANPLFWIPALLAVIVAAGVAIWQNWDWIKTKFDEVWGGIKTWFDSFSLYESGMKLITTFGDGILGAKDYVVGKFNEVLSKLREYMPFSDAKVGPLSQLTESGRKVVETFGEGINQSEGIGGNFASKVNLSDVNLRGGGMGGGNITFAPVIHISGASENVRGDVEAGLKAGREDFEKRMQSYNSQQRRLSYV